MMLLRKKEDYYSYDGNLDSAAEKHSNASLVVAGPMIDVYLKELGCQILHKLSRSKVTGIVQTSSTLIPWQIMVYILRLVKSYGGVIDAQQKKRSKEKSY